jgi:hypothetical protein
LSPATALHAAPRAPDLGTSWQEVEDNYDAEGNTAVKGVHATWRRRGKTNVFEAHWDGGVTAVATITSHGSSVHIARRHSSDGNDCDYDGQLSADGTQVAGTLRCGAFGPFNWSATIIKGEKVESCADREARHAVANVEAQLGASHCKSQSVVTGATWRGVTGYLVTVDCGLDHPYTQWRYRSHDCSEDADPKAVEEYIKHTGNK